MRPSHRLAVTASVLAPALVTWLLVTPPPAPRMGAALAHWQAARAASNRYPPAPPNSTAATETPSEAHVYLPYGALHAGPAFQVLANSSWFETPADGQAHFWGEVVNASVGSTLAARVRVNIRDSLGNVLDGADQVCSVGRRAFGPHEFSCFEIFLFRPMPAGWDSFDFSVVESAPEVRPLELTVVEHRGEHVVDWMGQSYKVTGRLLNETGIALACPTVTITSYSLDQSGREIATGCVSTGPCPAFAAEPGMYLDFSVTLYGTRRPYDDVTRYRVEAFGLQ